MINPTELRIAKKLLVQMAKVSEVASDTTITSQKVTNLLDEVISLQKADLFAILENI